MPPCPDGTHIKPEVLEDQFWIEVGNALEQLEGVLSPLQIQFLAQAMQQVAPSFIDLEVLCAGPAPDPPALSFDQLILSGQWASIPQWVVEWFWATYATNRWASFCECDGTTGAGTCPPVAEFGGSQTHYPTGGLKF